MKGLKNKITGDTLTAPKQRPGTRPLWKRPYERRAIAGTALTIAKTSLSSNGPSLGRWCDCKVTVPVHL